MVSAKKNDRGAKGDFSLFDRPEVSQFIFYPRRDPPPQDDIALYPVEVGEGVSVVCRFYPAPEGKATILYFHGNGETAGDYDLVSSLYSALGINLFVADYRGYGLSTGEPTISHILHDAHPIFERLRAVLGDGNYPEALFVMGRSLGSAPAIEVAHHYQKQLKGLIVESGFASSRKQFARLGVTHLFQDIEDPVGFCNDIKIREILIPTLIIHGEADQIIPVEEGKALYELSNARNKVSFFVPHAGHNDLMEQSLSDYMDSIVKFTDRE